jgi:hypothetical protein
VNLQKLYTEAAQDANSGQYKEAIRKFELILTHEMGADDKANVCALLGGLYLMVGNNEQGVRTLEEALAVEPNNAAGWSNLSEGLRLLGQLDEAIEASHKAITLMPNDAEAHNNLANTLQEMGRLEDAVSSYEHALKLNPDFYDAKGNLIKCLTAYTSPKAVSHPISEINKKIRKISIVPSAKKIISDAQVVQLFSKSLNILESDDLELETESSQVYRRNSVDMNCKRHMSIFDQHNVIPQYCFGCYKVQVEPRTIIELVKLLMIFDQLKLEDNNTRKCMIELRPEIPGFYKGLIYCSGLEQANKISDAVDVIVKENISSTLSAKVKRGCSEYASSFPDYPEINNSGPQLMNYNEDWIPIEDTHDRDNPIPPRKNLQPSLSGLNLQDVLIIKKWIDYARGIEDLSFNLLGNHALHDYDIFNEAQARTAKFPYAK